MNSKLTSLVALTMNDIRAKAPSVFATSPDAGVSDRYQFVNTARIIESMMEVGYVPTAASQAAAVTTDGSKSVHARHFVRMTHKSNLAVSARKVGDVVPQIILQNSHDRTLAFHMSGGLFRLVCLNGMATQSAGVASVRVLHNDKDINRLIIDGTNLIREITETTIMPQVEKMTQLEFTPAQERQFALGATVLKFGDARPAEVEKLLVARREEDAGRNMWAVLNRIQENAVKGGYETTDAAGRNVTSRGIQSAAKDFDFNLKLWNFGAKVLAEVA